MNSLTQAGSSPNTYTVSHNGAGDITTLLAPNGGEQTWSYDGAGRITGTTWLTGTTTLFTQTVTLDGAGQRTASNDSWGSSSYGYDTAGRLTSARYPDGSSEADQYDAGGNRTVITGTTTLAGTNVITNTYDLADELTGTASTQGNTTYSYDGNGNQTASYGITGVVTNTYNDLDQLTNVVGPGTNVSYVYDGQGDRLRSYEQSGTTPVLYNDAQDLAGGLSDLVSDGINDYTYLDPGAGEAPTAAYTLATSRTTYLATDVLGSVRLATDPTGAVIGAGAYDAWGIYQPSLGSSGAALLAGLQAVSPFGYAGQYYDAGAGTYSMRAREYNPLQGRFIGEDPQPYDPQVPVTISPYEYAGDMVTGTTDPSGASWVQVTPDASTGSLIRETILNDFVLKDPTHLSFTHVQLAASAGDPTVTVGQADLVSISPILHNGQPYGEAYDLEPYQNIVTTGAVSLFSAAQIPSEQALLENAYLHGLHVSSGSLCRSYNHLRLVAGEIYPDSIGLRDTHTHDYYEGPYVQKIVQTATDVYLTDAWQRGPGVIGYTTCRWQNTPGVSCPTPPTFQPSPCPSSFDPVTCTLDLVLLGGSLSNLYNCPPSDTACQGLSLLGFAGGIASIADGVEFLTSAAAAIRGASRLADDVGPATTVLETEDGKTVLEPETEAKNQLRHVVESPGCSTCFAADTLVAQPHGATAIANLQVGDPVLAENPATGKVEPEPIQAVIDDGVKPLIEVDLADGTAIKVTSNHYFWVDAGSNLSAPGWLEAGQLQPGDELRTVVGKDISVTGIRWNVGDAEVYTLTVATDHTFFVGSAKVLVHNANCELFNNGVELTQSARVNIRRNAQRLWERTTGYRASSKGWTIHHRVPLEYSNLFPDRYDPNNLANIVAMPNTEHVHLDGEWTTWRVANPHPTLPQVLKQTYLLDQKY